MNMSSSKLGRLIDGISADIDTESIREVVNVRKDGITIDPKKAKDLAQEKHPYTVSGATAGAIAAGVISASGGLVIPGSAIGAALAYIVSKDRTDDVKEVEDDFLRVFEAVDREEEVKLSRLAKITKIKKEVLREEYLPYLKQEGFVQTDEADETVTLNRSVLQRVISYMSS